MPSRALEAVRDHLIDISWRVAASSDLSPERAARAAMEEYFTATPVADVRCLPASAGRLRAEWFIDRVSDTGRRMLFLHGGGYVSGGISAYRNFAMWVAHEMRCAVLLIEYRLAPEHPFPQALEDAVVAFRWMREQGPDGPATAPRAFLLGDSAGGGLALATLVALRERGIANADAAVTFSAWTDLTNSGASMTENQDPRLGSVKAVPDLFAGLYLQGTDAKHPMASPLFASLKGLPPLLMQASAAEQFRDDTVRVVQKIRREGGEAHLDLWPDMVHVWQGFAPDLPEASEALRRAGEFIQSI